MGWRGCCRGRKGRRRRGAGRMWVGAVYFTAANRKRILMNWTLHSKFGPPVSPSRDATPLPPLPKSTPPPAPTTTPGIALHVPQPCGVAPKPARPLQQCVYTMGRCKQARLNNLRPPIKRQRRVVRPSGMLADTPGPQPPRSQRPPSTRAESGRYADKNSNSNTPALHER